MPPRKQRKKDRPLDAVAEIAADPILRVGQGLLFLKLALVVFVFDPNAADAFSLPKSAVGHLVTALVVVCLGSLLVRHGRAFLLWSPIHLAVAALFISFVVATLLAIDQTVALFGTWRRYLGLTQLADVVVLYVSTVHLFRTALDRSRLLTVVLAMAVPVCIYAFLQRFGIDVVKYKQGLPRPIAMFGQPDLLGAFAAIAAVTAFATAIWCWPALRPIARLGVLLVTLGCFFVELFTGVRAGALGILAGWVVLLIMLSVDRHSDRRRTLALAAIVGVAIGLGVAFSAVGPRLAPTTLASDPAVRERLEIWDTAWRLVQARPLLGLGPDNFANGYPSFRAEESQLLAAGQLQNSTHSWVFYYATSAGLLGLGAFMVFAALVIHAGVQLAQRGTAEAFALAPAAAYLGQGFVGINDLSLDWTLWLAAGVLAGATSQSLPVDPRKRRTAPHRYTLFGAAAALLIVLLFGLQGATQRIGGSRDLGLAQANIDAGTGSAAVPLARAALAADTRRPELWANYGAALSSAGDGAAAVRAFLEAARLDPTYPPHWRNLAIVLGELGNTTGAYAAVQRASAADPWDPEALDLFARLALARGQPELSAAKGALAVRLDPNNLAAYDAPVLANLSLSRFDEAERLLTEAFARGDTPALRFREAQLYAATGRRDLALRDLDLVLAAQPNNAEARALKQLLQGQ